MESEDIIMVDANVLLLIDLGNSETRAEVVYKGKSLKLELSNYFNILYADYVIPEDYRNEESTVFGTSGGYVANGEIVTHEFAAAIMKPTGRRAKSEQITSQYSIMMVMIKAVSIISGNLGIRPADINWVFDIACLLPPEEQANKVAASAMTEMITNITQLECISPIVFNIPVSIKSVKLFPEGVVAYTAALFNLKDGKAVVNPDNMKYRQGYTLVMDIGAGTTDFAMVFNGKFVAQSKATIKTGGNLVEAYCKREIRRRYSNAPTDMTEIIEHGVYTRGNQKIIVDDILIRAKNDFAATLNNAIMEYLEVTQLPVHELKGLLVIGGGAIAAERDGKVVSESLAYPLCETIKQMATSVELVHLTVNPRFANIEGLRIMSTMW